MGAKHSIVDGTQQMAADPKQIPHDAVDRNESMRLGGGFEPPHLALPLARRLVGDFRPVVLVSRGAVRDRRHDGAVGGRIAAKLIGDESPWLGALTLQQPTEEAFCCAPVATGLKEDIDHVAVLVDCTPKKGRNNTARRQRKLPVGPVPRSIDSVSHALHPIAPAVAGFIDDLTVLD